MPKFTGAYRDVQQAANESTDSSSESGKQQQSNVATEMAPRSSTKAAASTKTYVPGTSAAAAQAAGVSQVEYANPEADYFADVSVTATTNVTYSLYRFVGGVDNIGLLSSVQWTEAEYATESDISDFKTTMDVDLISEDNLDGMLDATSPAGMTPMMT